MLKPSLGHKAITESIHEEVLNINPRIYDIQFSTILKVMEPKQCPIEILEKAYSLAKRVSIPSVPSRDTAVLQESLGAWLSRDGSSLFLVEVGPRAEAKAKEFATDVIKLLQPSYGVIWNLSWIRSNGNMPSMIDMIKSLIFQALRHDPTLLHSHPHEMNITKFQSNHTEAEWIGLMTHIFSRLSKCFIIIEAEDIFLTHRDMPEWIQHFFELFQTLVDQAHSTGNLLKILVVGYGARHTAIVTGKPNRIVSSIQRPVPIPPRLRNRFAGGSRWKHQHGWSRLKPKF